MFVDFANRFLGGGVLQQGCVQEEIMFSVRPECLASMLFNTALGDLEAFSIVGPILYSKHTGYGRRMEYDGNAFDGRAERYADSLAICPSPNQEQRRERSSEGVHNCDRRYQLLWSLGETVL